ncbi:MAG: hypothetical protein DHS20C13_08460 [Thermodesulfobacteriota bacterium]|nr:MAG: hypothetical protein DHS20C13_08460 [Thermodesulfobacteriota bacterium]
MRKTFFTMLFVFTAVFTFHLMNSNAESSDTSEAAVANLEKQYFQALANQDVELMDSLLDEDFVLSTTSSKRFMKKKAFLKTLQKQVMTSHEITLTKIDIEGDKANSQVDISMTKTYDGNDHSGNYEVYSVWVNKDGNWKLLERKIKFLNPPE